MKRKLPFGGNKTIIPSPLGSRILSVLFLIALSFLSSPAFGDWSPLIERLVADGFEEEAVRALFSRPEVRFEAGPMSSKLEELFKKSCKTAQGLSSYNSKVVYKGLLKQKVITRARAYIRENNDLLEMVSSLYCVPKEIIVSILLVETGLSDSVGGRWAFNTLASMALCTDLETIRPYLPKRLISRKNEDLARTLCWQKADWAYAELKALILYSYWTGFDPLSLPGSIYGAIGLCQFMPSSALSYGVDADNDGRVNLFVKSDALYSIGNYLREHGWQCTMDKSSQKRVIFDYNKSSVYANTVLAVAEKLKNKSRTRQ